jgi:hypothetical protein
MAENLALESVPMTQEPHRNQDSRGSGAHYFCHAKYTHVSQTLWRGLRGPPEIFRDLSISQHFGGGTPRAERERWAYRQQGYTPSGAGSAKNHPIDVLHVLHAARVARVGSEASKACPQTREDCF